MVGGVVEGINKGEGSPKRNEDHLFHFTFTWFSSHHVAFGLDLHTGEQQENNYSSEQWCDDLIKGGSVVA